MGIADDDAERAVIEEFSMEADSELWIPLAVTQWKLGRLNKRTKNYALAAIERELNNVAEQWKPALVSRRVQELLTVKNQLCSEMPGKKKLRMPSWALKCPWEVGNVLQYKIHYLSKEHPLADHYVLLLVCGISETPPGKIPCESMRVRLYNWFDKSAPVTQLDRILAEPPVLIDFLTRGGTLKASHTIMPMSEERPLNEMQCISPVPLSKENITPEKVTNPMNGDFEEMIGRTLSQAIKKA